MPQDRKDFIKQAGSGLLLTGLPGWLSAENNTRTMDLSDLAQDAAPDDEKYWRQIAKKYYDVATDHINLENGYYGIQPKPVLHNYLRNVEYVNREAIRFARKIYPGRLTAIKKELADFLGISVEELIITRNATEALNIAIQGYPFQQGDEVLINQLDYFSMIETFRMLEKRGRIKVNAFEMPLLPNTEEDILEVYRKQITPKTRVILLTHVSNINGLIIPVAKISAMAREKGIDTITDSAHALGHVPFNVKGLGSDFVGMNLHKWIGNPVGAGLLYVRKERIKEMSAFYGDVVAAETSISKLEHFGTTPFAVILTIPDSINFHKTLGIEKINKRLHYLKRTWMDGFANDPKVELVTPLDLSCAIASFRVRERRSSEVADVLFKEHNILTIGRTLGRDGCVRVTPSIFNSLEDVQKLVKAIKQIV
jgi:selenocysteine lyase/cysteine desulfurase